MVSYWSCGDAAVKFGCRHGWFCRDARMMMWLANSSSINEKAHGYLTLGETDHIGEAKSSHDGGSTVLRVTHTSNQFYCNGSVYHPNVIVVNIHGCLAPEDVRHFCSLQCNVKEWEELILYSLFAKQLLCVDHATRRGHKYEKQYESASRQRDWLRIFIIKLLDMEKLTQDGLFHQKMSNPQNYPTNYDGHYVILKSNPTRGRVPTLLLA